MTKLLIAILSLTCLAGTVASAEDEFSGGAARERFREVAGQLRCPTCAGVSVLDSEAGFSEQIKNMVKEQLREGKSSDEILSFFVERYGPWILRSPPASGINLIAWVLPVLLLGAGPVLVWVFLVHRRSAVPGTVRSRTLILAEMEAELTR